MYFLDNSAHIFELPDYSKSPIGYEYDEQDYIFWFTDYNDNTRLSVNNYYGKIINVLFEISNIQNLDDTAVSSIYDIEIISNSENFQLVRAIDFQEAIHEKKSILEYIESIDRFKVLSSKNNDRDILIIKVNQNGKNYIMIPIYVIGTSKYTGTWLTNILIHVSNKFNNTHTYCPITVGGIFNDEYEPLIIHGKNMGINLPKEILKAINGTSIDNEVFDEELYNKKIKEYLLNYINIKGELGNYNSALNSLKWFGYQDSIELYKLLETDNQFQTQYVRDYFTIEQDIIQAFNYFLNSQFIGLKFKLNTETGKLSEQNINSEFWGEGLPLLTDNDSKYDYKYTGEYLDQSYEEKTNKENSNQQFKYTSTYLNYTIYDLMFKLSYLKYYYQTYFLPIFIILKNMNIEYKVYATPNKYLTCTSEHYYESSINTISEDDAISFDIDNVRYFTHQQHFVDDNFNEFNNKENKYEINDTCLFIPIEFKYHEDINDQYKNYYNCILILKDNIFDKIIYKSNFSFMNTIDNKYLGFVFYPKMVNELYNTLFTYINKDYTLYINVNNKWFEYDFTTKLHELDLHVGTLNYKYWINDISYFNKKYQELNNTDNRIIFKFEEDNVELDITNYVVNNDFFDYSTKYLSNFPQIDKITDTKVIFNTFMYYPDLIYSNNINFGLWEKNIKTNDIIDENEINSYIKTNISELVNKYQSQLNLINNYKYFNNIHMYSLYEKTYEEKNNILKYKNNLSILCNKVLVETFYDDEQNKTNFKLTKISYDNITENDEEINHYLLENSLSLEERDAYYFILERNIDESGNYYFTGNNANTLYSYYDIIDNDNKHEVGYIICPINNGQIDMNNDDLHNSVYDFSINKDYNIDNIRIDNNSSIIYIDDDNFVYNMKFNFTPLVKNTEYSNENDIINDYKPYSNEEYDGTQQIYAKLDLFYYNKLKVLNVYGYYNIKFCSQMNNYTCTVDFSKIGLDIDPIDNVQLHKAAGYIGYFDIRYTPEISINESNQSLYWTTVDELENIENDDISLIDVNMNNSVESMIDEHPRYINYLYRNITGLKGLYKMKQNNDCPIKLTVSIDNQIYEYDYNNDENNKFKLTGDETEVLVYFKYNQDNISEDGTIFKPEIVYYDIVESEVVYDENYDIVDWYKKFFYKKYTISLNEYNKEIWESKIQLDQNNNYDTYLMTDKNVWYFMFISKNTCDDNKILNNLNNYPENIIYNDEQNNKQYTLRHIITKQLFLINRMDINWVDNIYHFNTNDMIVCSLHNNKMLPNNVNITSKWKITPISYKSNNTNIIYANTNTAIVSINNLNSYNKGYYNLQVNYSLDGNITNSQVINKKILIKKE